MKILSNVVRPQSIKDVLGQEHLKNLLNKMLEKQSLTSLILFGKPGIGKTSLAFALCNDINKTFSYFNSTTGNKGELMELIKINDVLIIDEIHRLNKDKQDILLAAIEFARVIVIATTTENPYFVISPAIRSRMNILELKPLNNKEIVKGLKHIIQKHQLNIKISQTNLENIAKNSNGDYRYCINILELIHKLYPNTSVTTKILKNIMPSIHFYSDKGGEGHYDLLSAFHKSLRGSDVDASLYYLALLLESGDILGLERRMLMVAYEDIGLASPNVALRVNTAIEVAKKVGLPEAKIPLSNAIIDLAKAPKSNSAYLGINNAIYEIRHGGVFEIPSYLKDAHYKSASKLNRGIGYKYPHNYDGGKVVQQYLPDKLKNKKFFKANKNDKL